MEWEENFRTQLKARREAADESQSALAKRIAASGLPFHQPTVQRIEDGERPVRLDEAHVIAEALGTTVAAMTSTADPFALEQDPAVVELGRSWGAIQKSTDDALYKIAGLAGQLDHFADLIESHPEAADAIWGDDGPNDWPAWVESTARALTRYASHRAVVADGKRRADLLRALDALARSAVREPSPVGDVADSIAWRDAPFVSEAELGDPDGEHQAES